MAADCSYLRSSTAFPTVCAPYCSADGSVLLILPLANSFHDGLHATDCSLYRSFFRSSTSIIPGRFAYRIPQRMAADYSFFRSSTAFTTVCVPYCSADGIGLVNLPLANCFHDDLRAANCSPYRSFFRSSTSIIPGRFAYRIPQRMAADYSFFRSSTDFTTVCAPYCPADGSGLLIPPLINGFHDGLRAVLLCGWQRIAQSSACQQLSIRFTRRIPQRMVSDCPHLRSPTAFTTICAPYCSADGIALLTPPLVNGFHDGLHAVLLSGWQRIAQSSTRQQLSRQFARCIPPRLVSDCAHLRSPTTFTTIYAPYCTPDGVPDRSFFLSSTAFTRVCAPYCSADGSGLLIPPVINGFPDGLRAVLLSGWQHIAHSSAHQRLSGWFARRIARPMAADCSYLRSSTAYPTVYMPYYSADGSALLILPLINSFPDGSHAVLRSGWQRIAHTSARQCLSRRFARRIAQ